MTGLAGDRKLAHASSSSRSWWRQVRHETRWQVKLYLRTPPALFFTFALPVALLLVFRWRFEDERLTAAGLEFAALVVPAIAAVAMIVACYAGLAIEVAGAREKGILKRLRATPLAPSAYLVARILSVVAIGAAAALLMLFVGALFLGVSLDAGRLVRALAVLVVGGACFSALGLAVGSVAPSVGAASAAANFTLLPLLLFSGAIMPSERGPAWAQTLSTLLPLEPFAQAMRAAMGDATGTWLRWLVTLSLWAAFGSVIALRSFGWMPRTEHTR